MKKKTVEAVHDEDLQVFLESLGLLDGIREGKYHCHHCNIVITFHNLLAVYPFKDEIRFACSNFECFKLMNEEIASQSMGDANGQLD